MLGAVTCTVETLHITYNWTSALYVASWNSSNLVLLRTLALGFAKNLFGFFHNALQTFWATQYLMLLNCGVGEDFWESLGQQGDPTSPSWKRSVLDVHWKDWCWSWNSNTLATWCKELTHWKRPWCRERLRAGGEGDDRRWDGWMASPTQWTWVWVNSGSCWWIERPGVLWFMGLQRVRHDWATEVNIYCFLLFFILF